jgi:hypothetical protein
LSTDSSGAQAFFTSKPSQNRPFLETQCSAFRGRGAPLLQARDFLLENLKSQLIIRISKDQAIDEKPETHGGDEKDWGRARLQEEQHELLNIEARHSKLAVRNDLR